MTRSSCSFQTASPEGHLPASLCHCRSHKIRFWLRGSFTVWSLQKPLQLSHIFGQPFPFLAWHTSKCAEKHKPVAVGEKRAVWYRQWSRKLRITCISTGLKSLHVVPVLSSLRPPNIYKKQNSFFKQWGAFFSNNNIMQKGINMQLFDLYTRQVSFHAYVCTFVCRCLWRSEERVTGASEPPDMGAGHQTLGLWKSCKYSYPWASSPAPKCKFLEGEGYMPFLQSCYSNIIILQQ